MQPARKSPEGPGFEAVFKEKSCAARGFPTIFAA
jgi:hypothetical protein